MENELDIDWAAIVDLLASEYGWTVEYIASLNLGQIIKFKARIQKRYEQKNGDVSDAGEAVPSSETLSISDFETKLGGKRRVRPDGVTEIII